MQVQAGVLSNKLRAVNVRLPFLGDRPEPHQGSHRKPLHDQLLDFVWNYSIRHFWDRVVWGVCLLRKWLVSTKVVKQTLYLITSICKTFKVESVLSS